MKIIKLLKIVPFFWGLLSLLLSYGVYAIFLKWIGFPDGYITPHDEIIRLLCYFFISVNSTIGVLCLWLGITANHRVIREKLGWIIGIQLFCLLIVIIGYHISGVYLDKGTGG